MKRRSFLKTTGGIGTAAVVGVGGLALTSGSVSAQSSLSISGTSVSTDAGDVTQVGVQIDHQATWDGFDVPVEAVAYRDVVKRVDGDGNVTATHVLHDNTDTPVLLENWSSDGDGSDGWGGPGEYTSGPGTEGAVNADIDWTVLAEDPSNAANSIESPGQIDDFNLDNPSDGTDKTSVLRYVKEVYFYTTDSSGSYTTDDGTQVRLMGGDDGTLQKVSAEDDFQVTVTNEEATATSSGSGSSSAS